MKLQALSILMIALTAGQASAGTFDNIRGFLGFSSSAQVEDVAPVAQQVEGQTSTLATLAPVVAPTLLEKAGSMASGVFAFGKTQAGKLAPMATTAKNYVGGKLLQANGFINNGVKSAVAKVASDKVVDAVVSPVSFAVKAAILAAAGYGVKKAGEAAVEQAVKAKNYVSEKVFGKAPEAKQEVAKEAPKAADAEQTGYIASAKLKLAAAYSKVKSAAMYPVNKVKGWLGYNVAPQGDVKAVAAAAAVAPKVQTVDATVADMVAKTGLPVETATIFVKAGKTVADVQAANAGHQASLAAKAARENGRK